MRNKTNIIYTILTDTMLTKRSYNAWDDICKSVLGRGWLVWLGASLLPAICLFPDTTVTLLFSAIDRVPASYLVIILQDTKQDYCIWISTLLSLTSRDLQLPN